MDYQHVDLSPTLRDILNLQSGEVTDGFSVYAADRPKRVKQFAMLVVLWRYDEESDTWMRADGE